MPTNKERMANALIHQALVEAGTFRPLSAEDEAEFRQWMRNNWTPELPNPTYHPEVRDEWFRIEKERNAHEASTTSVI